MGRIDRHGDGVTRMNGRELKALQLVWAALGSMEHSSGEALEERLKRAGAWNAWRLASSWLKKALGLMVSKTVYLEQQQLCEYVLKNGTIDVAIRAGMDKDLVVVPAEALQAVCNEAMAFQCAMCLKDDREIRRCRLRRHLLRVAVPDSLETNGCVYRDVVLASEKPGEYIEI